MNSAGSFGIKSENMSHIINILRNKLYTNKHLAVLREYTINAMDAHIDAGMDKPIQIAMPTLEDPRLRIRDYAPDSIPDEDMLDTFIMYGSSTKRETNQQTGGLGIGCKAAFCMVDMFDIVTYQKNKTTHWTASIDEANIGSLYKVDEITDRRQPQGTEVIIPVNPKDIESFVSEAHKLFKWFKPLPVVLNVDMEFKKQKAVMFGDRWLLNEHISPNSGHEYRRAEGKAIALMGNIPYQIDSSLLPNSLDEWTRNLIVSKNLVMHFPIGALDIAASRESLEYTDKTIQGISVECNRIKQDMVNNVQEQIADSDSMFDAARLSKQALDPLPSYLHNLIFAKLKFKGMDLRTQFSTGMKINAHFRKHRWRAGDYTNAKEEQHVIKLNSKMKILTYNADEITQANATRRVRTIQDQDGWDNEMRYYVIPITYTNQLNPDKDTNLTNAHVWATTNALPHKFLKKRKLNETWGTHYHQLTIDHDLMDVAPMKADRKVVDKDGNVKEYKRLDTCRIQASALASGRIVEDSEVHPFNGFGETEIIYIPLDRYSWHNRQVVLEQDNLQCIIRGVKHLCDLLNITDTPIIHGVKKHFIKKLDAEWITLDAWYAKHFKRFIQSDTKHKRILKNRKNNASHSKDAPSWWDTSEPEWKALEHASKTHKAFPAKEELIRKLELDRYEYYDTNPTYDITHNATTPEVCSARVRACAYVNHLLQNESPVKLNENTPCFAKIVVKAHPMLKCYNHPYEYPKQSNLHNNDLLDYLTR
tara:strand:+ start:8014 stop:10293 length:2280 start_codon:yes stop_codon:yes gene_type:complete